MLSRRDYHRAYYQRNAERLRERRRVQKLMAERMDGVLPLSRKERMVRVTCERMRIRWEPPRRVIRQYLADRDAIFAYRRSLALARGEA
jgi:hypothetical protein